MYTIAHTHTHTYTHIYTYTYLYTQSVHAALKVCNAAQEYRLCHHYFEQLVCTYPLLISRGTIAQVLYALSSLAKSGSVVESHQAVEILKWSLQQAALGAISEHSLPDAYCFGLAQLACNRAQDWSNALEVFRLMTGYNAQDFSDTNVQTLSQQAPRREPRSQGRLWPANLHILANLLRMALNSRDLAKIRQALRIVDHLEESAKAATKDERVPELTKRLTEDVASSVDMVLVKRESIQNEDMQRWLKLKRRMQSTIKAQEYPVRGHRKDNRHSAFNETDMMQEAIDFQTKAYP